MPDEDSTGITIKSVSGRVLYVSTASSVPAAVREAVQGGADLRDADLRGADLGGADLRGADLRGADLGYADLRDADLGGANLRGANLHGADLRGADLGYANLGYANLRDADLRYADLRYAKLRYADLRYADLRDADLRGADLRDADLRGADLRGANLHGANLGYANLHGANLRDAKNADLAIAKTRIIPNEGPIIGWKKAHQDHIVKLRIPAKAKRSHASGRKCRADQAKVLAIYDQDGAPVNEAFSHHDKTFRYTVGATVTPTEPFDTDMWNECASGIHFYITRLEAENHA